MRRTLVVIAIAGCGGSGGGTAADATIDRAGDPCAAPSLSIDDFYRCRSRLTCALLEDCRATDTRHLDCDDLPHEQLGTTARDRRSVEASIAAGHASWDGTAAAACLAGAAATGCELFELAVDHRLTCSGVVGNLPDGAPCERTDECATPGARCGLPAPQIGSCLDWRCVPPHPLGASCADGDACAPGDHCVPELDDQLVDITSCHSGAIDQRCDVDDDCDLGLFCLDGLANGDAVGRCFPVRAAGASCRTDRECAGELACVGENQLGPGICRDLREDGAPCDDTVICFGARFCDLAEGNRGACHAMPRAGDACVFAGLPDFCGSELTCDHGRCAPPGALGDRCVTSVSSQLGPLDCNRGLFCSTELVGIPAGTCRALQPDLEQCHFPSQCVSGVCDHDVCAPVPACGG